MPKTKKGVQIQRAFTKQYGKRGKQIMYATANKQGGGLYRHIHGRSKRRSR